jgi:hypothetical protein
MQPSRFIQNAARCAVLVAMAGLAACGSTRKASSVRNQDRECMARAMYFESNRSSDEGMLAVGTVVMNRVGSDKFPNTVCGVVGQKKQFAPGVLSRPMTDSGRERAYRMADEVLRGKRHRGVGDKAMFFHTAGTISPTTTCTTWRWPAAMFSTRSGPPKAASATGRRSKWCAFARAEQPARRGREVQVAEARRPAVRVAAARPAPKPVTQWQPAPEPAWQEAPQPVPALAVRRFPRPGSASKT